VTSNCLNRGEEGGRGGKEEKEGKNRKKKKKKRKSQDLVMQVCKILDSVLF